MAKVVRTSDDESINRVLITVAAEIFMVCAVVLFLFVYLSNSLSLSVATAIAVMALFAGSLFCWKSFAAAQIILLLSLLLSEFVVVNFAGGLLLPFVVIDVFVLVAVMRVWQSKED